MAYDEAGNWLNPPQAGTDLCRFQFSSKEHDASTGFSYFGYRFYSPHWQKWLNYDPIEEEGSFNLYAYVSNDPINYLDPFGLRIMIVGHLAAGPLGRMTKPNSYHLAIWIDPDDKTKCPGRWPMTLGGQKGSNGKLVNAVNYPGDALENATFQQALKPPAGQSESDFIRNLRAAAAHYKNNLPYSLPNISLLPGSTDGTMAPGEYNSNSYVSGVINAAGGTPPVINTGGRFQVPGYANPIPIP